MSEATDNNDPSILEKIKSEWKASGSKDPLAKDKEELLNAWKKATSAREAAEKAIDNSIEAESNAVLALAKAFGARSLRIDGVVYDFASRGAKVFFRRKGSAVVDL